jgi:hypothetical protein
MGLFTPTRKNFALRQESLFERGVSGGGALVTENDGEKSAVCRRGGGTRRFTYLEAAERVRESGGGAGKAATERERERERERREECAPRRGLDQQQKQLPSLSFPVERTRVMWKESVVVCASPSMRTSIILLFQTS